MSRNRNYLVTVNYRDDDEQPWETINEARLRLVGGENPDIKYACAQIEAGETGRPHVQAVVCFRQPKSLSAARDSIGIEGIHLEAIGSTQADLRRCIDYCRKAAGRIEGPWEWGEAPAQGRRSDLATVASRIIRGEDERKLAFEYPSTFIQYGRGIRVFQGLIQQPQAQDRKLYWIAGTTGVGKSHLAWNRFPDAYGLFQWKWWEGYGGQSVVIADDLDLTEVQVGEFLRYTDRWPARVPIKGGSVPIRFTTIIFTSNVPWEDFKARLSNDGNQLDAVQRRLTKSIWATQREDLIDFFD